MLGVNRQQANDCDFLYYTYEIISCRPVKLAP